MIPGQILSAEVKYADWREAADAIDTAPWVDYEMGGVALNDPSQGLLVKIWRLRYVSPDVRISADGVAESTLFTAAGLTELSLAFDQNMRPVVAYVQSGEAKLRWYDALTESVTTTTLAAGVETPRVCLDDKRPLQFGNSDVILAYVRDGGLYFRAQRDRYDVEYLLQADVGGTLIRVGMNEISRLQFMLRT